MEKKTNFQKKVSQCRRTESGDIHSVAKQQKIEGGPYGEKFFPKQKFRSDKKIGRAALWSRPVWYVTRGNRTNLFVWFSSLGQMVQFGAIIFCRTFKNYFGQFVWIEKKEKSL